VDSIPDVDEGVVDGLVESDQDSKPNGDWLI
jgi:hypothetical protein